MLTCGCSCCLAAVSWCQVNDLHSSSHTDAVVSYSVSAFFSENKYSLNWLKSRLKMWVGPNLCPSVPFVAVLQSVEWRSRRKSLTRYECVHFIPWLTSYSPVRFVPAALLCWSWSCLSGLKGRCLHLQVQLVLGCDRYYLTMRTSQDLSVLLSVGVAPRESGGEGQFSPRAFRLLLTADFIHVISAFYICACGWTLYEVLTAVVLKELLEQSCHPPLLHRLNPITNVTFDLWVSL